MAHPASIEAETLAFMFKGCQDPSCQGATAGGKKRTRTVLGDAGYKPVNAWRHEVCALFLLLVLWQEGIKLNLTTSLRFLSPCLGTGAFTRPLQAGPLRRE